MAWGDWTSGFSNNCRVGIELDRSGNTITAEYLIQFQYIANDTMTLVRSGAITGSQPFRYDQGGGVYSIGTWSRTGTPGSLYTFGAEVTSIYNGANPEIDDIAISIPDTPAGDDAVVFAKINGTWRETQPYAKIGGTWREIHEAYVKIDGTWRLSRAA